MPTKKSGGGGGGKYRDSKTGEYVTKKYADKHPDTTEHERGPHKPPKKK